MSERGAHFPRSHPPGERPLRVGLNLVFLGERAGGTGRYARELPGALLAAAPNSELHVFISRDAPADLREEPWAQEVHWVRCPVGLRDQRSHLVFQFALLPALAAARRLDVLHSLANLGPALTPRVASVVSLLDTIWMQPPEEWGGTARAQRTLRRLAGHSARHADQVLAISHAGAREISASLGVPSERIHVTPLGVSAPAAEATAADPQALRERLGLGRARVLLCVAQKHPYKNLACLLRALPVLPADVVLVLPGAHTDHEQELRALAAQLGMTERVRFPEWLTQAELEGLYALSKAFVLPSLVEGFGLPILEAMQRDLPVACADVAALREVAGDAALLFDPHDQAQIDAALIRLLEDPALATQLSARGRARIKQFTWRATGEATLAGYRRALGGR